MATRHQHHRGGDTEMTRVTKLTQMSDSEWEETARRLVAYARSRARHFSWLSGRNHLLAKGKLPEDLAYEAIVKVLATERRWVNDPRYRALLPYLMSVVDSLTSHLAVSPDNQARVDREIDSERAKEVTEEAVAGREFVDRSVRELRTTLTGKPDLLALLDAIVLTESDKPREIAEYLGIPIGGVYAQLKRLRRIARFFSRDFTPPHPLHR